MKKYIASILWCCALLLAGCGGRYQVHQLKPIKRSKAHFVQTKNGVEARVRMLSKHAVSTLFNGQSLPIQSTVAAYAITILNTTDKPVFLPAQNIKLALLSDKEVYALLMRGYASGVLGHMVGWPVGAVVCLPIALGGLFIATIARSNVGVILCLGVGCAALAAISVGLLTGVGTAVRIANFNKALGADLRNKILANLMIAPHSQETRLFFTRAGQPAFTLAVQDGDKDSVLFDVCLKK